MTERRRAIDWESARDSNRLNWDDRVALHEQAYGLAAFDDPTGGSVAGLDVCHLQCHIGTDTLSQARAAVSGDFDLVYTSIGTITWLHDLTAWAAQIHALLRPGGTFFIRDGHPVLYSLDETAPELRIAYRYFGDGTAQQWDEPGSYAGDGVVAHTRSYEWPHPISEIVSALLGAGLRLSWMAEGRTLPWQFSPRMVPVPGGFAWPDDERELVPCTFTLIARRD